MRRGSARWSTTAEVGGRAAGTVLGGRGGNADTLAAAAASGAVAARSDVARGGHATGGAATRADTPHPRADNEGSARGRRGPAPRGAAHPRGRPRGGVGVAGAARHTRGDPLSPAFGPAAAAVVGPELARWAPLTATAGAWPPNGGCSLPCKETLLHSVPQDRLCTCELHVQQGSYAPGTLGLTMETDGISNIHNLLSVACNFIENRSYNAILSKSIGGVFVESYIRCYGEFGLSAFEVGCALRWRKARPSLQALCPLPRCLQLHGRPPACRHCARYGHKRSLVLRMRQ